MGVVLRQRPRYFHKKTEMKSFTKPLVSIAVLLTIAITSCSKLLDNPPIPLPNIHSLEEFPFQDYVDSLNALALQSTISTGEVSDFLYVINGVYDFRQTPTGDNNGYYILPFVSKSFTFEGEYLVEYDPNHPLTGPPFNGFFTNSNNLFGTVDIGFIPEPQ